MRPVLRREALGEVSLADVEKRLRTQRWEGSRPRPAAAGSFPKPTAYPDQGRKCTGTRSRRARIRLRHPYVNITCSG